MRIITFCLFCTLPVFCFGQSPSTGTASLQHKQAVQHLLQQIPKANFVDLTTSVTPKDQRHNACNSCAKKASFLNKKQTQKAHLTSKGDLLAKKAHLLHNIQQLQEATPVNQSLLAKYQHVLKITLEKLKTIESSLQNEKS